MKKQKEPFISLDFESRNILKQMSKDHDVDIDLLIQAFLVGTLRTMEMLETIAMGNLLNDDYELPKNIFDKKKKMN